MFLKRRRSSFVRRRRSKKRQFTSFRRRSTFVRRSFKRKGFVKGYKKAAFQGRKIRPYRKFFTSFHNRRNINYNISATLTNVNTIASDNSWIYMPMAALTQVAQAYESAVPGGFQSAIPIDMFTGVDIYLTGIQLDMLVVSEVSQDFYLRILCFWVEKDDMLFQAMENNAAGSSVTIPFNWTPTGTLANAIPSPGFSKAQPDTVRFLDLPYADTAGYGNFNNFTTRPNPNYPGKLLFDFKQKLTCTASIATAGGNPSTHFKKYLPFNKEFKWETVPEFSTEIDDGTTENVPQLTSTPNFGKYGQPVFVIYYANTTDVPSSGTEASIAISGNSTVYFKDI